MFRLRQKERRNQTCYIQKGFDVLLLSKHRHQNLSINTSILLTIKQKLTNSQKIIISIII